MAFLTPDCSADVSISSPAFLCWSFRLLWFLACLPGQLWAPLSTPPQRVQALLPCEPESTVLTLDPFQCEVACYGGRPLVMLWPSYVSPHLTLAQLSGTGSRAGALTFPRWDQHLRKPSQLCSTRRSTRWPVSSRLSWRPSHRLWGVFLRWVPGGKAHSSVGSTRGCGPRSLLPSCRSTRRLQQCTNVIFKSPAVYTHRASAQGGQIYTGVWSPPSRFGVQFPHDLCPLVCL